jgi:hypothetical protein
MPNDRTPKDGTPNDRTPNDQTPNDRTPNDRTPTELRTTELRTTQLGEDVTTELRENEMAPPPNLKNSSMKSYYMKPCNNFRRSVFRLQIRCSVLFDVQYLLAFGHSAFGHSVLGPYSALGPIRRLVIRRSVIRRPVFRRSVIRRPIFRRSVGESKYPNKCKHLKCI